MKKQLILRLKNLREEKGFKIEKSCLQFLGSKKQLSRKLVIMFMVMRDYDTKKAYSNTFQIEWPKGSGKVQEFSEMDKAEWIELYENAISSFQKLGFSVVETKNVRTYDCGTSSSVKEHALQVEELFLNPQVDFILCVTGGDYLFGMLSFLDMSIIQNHPKWIQGYSDPTFLLFLITTKLDIAAVYGGNVMRFGMENYHSSVDDNLEILRGNLVV